MRPVRCPEARRGFTLVEAVATIAITGVLAAIVAVFIRAPVQGYFDSVRRAQLTDAADTALRRMARDLRLALPNSVRVASAGSNVYLEFMQTRAGGRYRAEPTSTGSGDALDFTAADASFDVLGPPVEVAAGDLIVVYNLGIPGADAWSGSAESRRGYAGAAGSVNTIGLAPNTAFPFASPRKRFHVVESAVTYECDVAAGVLRRRWGYTPTAAQATPPAGGSSAVLADNLVACAITYDPDVAHTRSGLVTLLIELAAPDAPGERLRLFHQVNVSNTP